MSQDSLEHMLSSYGSAPAAFGAKTARSSAKRLRSRMIRASMSGVMVMASSGHRQKVAKTGNAENSEHRTRDAKPEASDKWRAVGFVFILFFSSV